jgi:O-antigen/teichoic acid export membrane protein
VNQDLDIIECTCDAAGKAAGDSAAAACAAAEGDLRSGNSLKARAGSFLRLVLSRDAGDSSPEGRCRDRYRRAARTAVTAIIARAVGILATLATVPLTLSYLGTERFGLWMALTGFVSFMTFTDLGLGTGLQNALAACHGRDDRKTPKSLVSSAMAAMIAVLALVTAFALLVLPEVPLANLFKLEDASARDEILGTAQALLIAFALGLPAGLMTRVYDAYQRGYWGHIWVMVGRVAGLGGVIVCIAVGAPLPALAAALMGIPFACLAVGGVVLFWRQPHVRPSLGAVRWSALAVMSRMALAAVGAQVAFMIMIHGPAVVLGCRMGSAAVTQFYVTQRLLALPVSLVSVVTAALWPAYGEAAARGDLAWVRRAFRGSCRLALTIYVPVFIIMMLSGSWIIRMWTNEPAAVPSFSLLMACDVWGAVMAWNAVASMLLNGLSRMAGQAIYGMFFAVAAMAVAWAAAPYFSLETVAWLMVLVGLLTNGIALGLEAGWRLRKTGDTPAATLLAVERG